MKLTLSDLPARARSPIRSRAIDAPLSARPTSRSGIGQLEYAPSIPPAMSGCAEPSLGRELAQQRVDLLCGVPIWHLHSLKQDNLTSAAIRKSLRT